MKSLYIAIDRRVFFVTFVPFWLIGVIIGLLKYR